MLLFIHQVANVEEMDIELEAPMAGFNDPLVGDWNIAGAPLVDNQPEAEGEEEIEQNQFFPQALRRSTRNFFPRHSKKKKLLLGLPTSDDEEDIVRVDAAMSAMVLDHDISKPFDPVSVLMYMSALLKLLECCNRKSFSRGFRKVES